MRLLTLADLIHEVLIDHEGIMCLLENPMAGMSWTRFGHPIEIEDFSSQGLHVHGVKDVFHLVFSQVVVFPAPYDSADLLVEYVSHCSENLVQHLEIDFLGQSRWELQLKIRRKRCLSLEKSIAICIDKLDLPADLRVILHVFCDPLL